MLLLCACLSLGCPGVQAAQEKSSGGNAGESRGQALFASNCAVCHGVDGRGGEHGPNIATTPEVVGMADKNLIDILKRGISGTGMPGFGWFGQEKILAAVAYLRTLQGKNHRAALPGNAELGEKLFFGRAQCSECHMAQGKGGFIASDLSYSDSDTGVDRLRKVILDPANTLPARLKGVTVTTRDGQRLTGALRAEDNFSISIQTMDGAFRYLPRSQLTAVEIGVGSLMPIDYRSRLNDAEVDDLISYLIRISSESGKRQEPADDDDDQ